MPRPRRGAWIYTPEHSASRAQGNVQTLGDDTCIGYQVLLDNTRDARRRTVRPQLSLSCAHLFRIVQKREARVLLCSYRILSLSVWLKLLRRKKTSTHQPCTVTFLASMVAERRFSISKCLVFRTKVVTYERRCRFSSRL